MIQVWRPVEEIEDALRRGGPRMPLTDVCFADGKVQNYIEYEGQPRMYEEKPEQVFPTLRLTDGKLTGAQLIGTDVYYTFSEIGQAYIPAWSLQQDWLNRYGRLWTLTGVRLASDGVDYEIEDAGRPRDPAKSFMRPEAA